MTEIEMSNVSKYTLTNCGNIRELCRVDNYYCYLSSFFFFSFSSFYFFHFVFSFTFYRRIARTLICLLTTDLSILTLQHAFINLHVLYRHVHLFRCEKKKRKKKFFFSINCITKDQPQLLL